MNIPISRSGQAHIINFMSSADKAAARAAIGVPSADELTAIGNSIVEFDGRFKTKDSVPKVVVFIDDDNGKDFLTSILPLVQNGTVNHPSAVPYVAAVCTGRVNNATTNSIYGATAANGWMTWADIATVAAAGVEIVGHSTSHLDLALATDETVIRGQVTAAITEIRSHGYACKHYVYPFGAYNDKVARIVAEDCLSGVSTSQGSYPLNNYPLKTYHMTRVPMGSFTNGNNDLADYTQSVDVLNDDGGILIFMTHVFAAEHDSLQDQHLIGLIDYIRDLGIPIKTLSGALDEFAHTWELTPQDHGQDLALATPEGAIFAKSLGLIALKKGILNNGSLPKDIPFGQSKMLSFSADNGGFPSVSGTCYFDRAEAGNETGLTKRVWVDYVNGGEWISTWKGDTWGAWTAQNAEVLKNSLLASAGPDDWSSGETMMVKTGAADHGWPSLTGLARTVVPKDREFSVQYWYPLNSSVGYYRCASSAATWNDFSLVGASKKTPDYVFDPLFEAELVGVKVSDWSYRGTGFSQGADAQRPTMVSPSNGLPFLDFSLADTDMTWDKGVPFDAITVVIAFKRKAAGSTSLFGIPGTDFVISTAGGGNPLYSYQSNGGSSYLSLGSIVNDTLQFVALGCEASSGIVRGVNVSGVSLEATPVGANFNINNLPLKIGNTLLNFNCRSEIHGIYVYHELLSSGDMESARVNLESKLSL